MDVSIDFESVEPPAGRACRVANGEWLQFAGWLDLIGALERLLEAGRRPLPTALGSERLEGRDAS